MNEVGVFLVWTFGLAGGGGFGVRSVAILAVDVAVTADAVLAASEAVAGGAGVVGDLTVLDLLAAFFFSLSLSSNKLRIRLKL